MKTKRAPHFVHGSQTPSCMFPIGRRLSRLVVIPDGFGTFLLFFVIPRTHGACIAIFVSNSLVRLGGGPARRQLEERIFKEAAVLS